MWIAIEPRALQPYIPTRGGIVVVVAARAGFEAWPGGSCHETPAAHERFMRQAPASCPLFTQGDAIESDTEMPSLIAGVRFLIEKE